MKNKYYALFCQPVTVEYIQNYVFVNVGKPVSAMF
jgi:hypothetical protein